MSGGGPTGWVSKPPMSRYWPRGFRMALLGCSVSVEASPKQNSCLSYRQSAAGDRTSTGKSRTPRVFFNKKKKQEFSKKKKKTKNKKQKTVGGLSLKHSSFQTLHCNERCLHPSRVSIKTAQPKPALACQVCHVDTRVLVGFVVLGPVHLAQEKSHLGAGPWALPGICQATRAPLDLTCLNGHRMTQES